jgi:hypothetical protein
MFNLNPQAQFRANLDKLFQVLFFFQRAVQVRYNLNGGTTLWKCHRIPLDPANFKDLPYRIIDG